MAVRTRRLGETSVATGGGGGSNVVVFTVPADRTAIVKDLRFALLAATAFPVTIIFDIVLANTTVRRVWQDAQGSLGTRIVSDWFLVLHEGDALRVTIPASVTLQVYASGSLLQGDPA